jgi:hypothetical protein
VSSTGDDVTSRVQQANVMMELCLTRRHPLEDLYRGLDFRFADRNALDVAADRNMFAMGEFL